MRIRGWYFPLAWGVEKDANNASANSKRTYFFWVNKIILQTSLLETKNTTIKKLIANWASPTSKSIKLATNSNLLLAFQFSRKGYYSIASNIMTFCCYNSSHRHFLKSLLDCLYDSQALQADLTAGRSQQHVAFFRGWLPAVLMVYVHQVGSRVGQPPEPALCMSTNPRPQQAAKERSRAQTCHSPRQVILCCSCSYIKSFPHGAR